MIRHDIFVLYPVFQARAAVGRRVRSFAAFFAQCRDHRPSAAEVEGRALRAFAASLIAGAS